MSDAEALRRMVREVLREVLPQLYDRARDSASDRATQPAGDVSASDVRRVRVADDRDLADLVTQVLNLAEDPSSVAGLRAGRIRFTLETRPSSGASGVHEAGGSSGPLEVERGAVTERLVQRAAREQRPLHVGPRAVVTPLARDRARALGVTIHRTARGETR